MWLVNQEVGRLRRWGLPGETAADTGDHTIGIGVHPEFRKVGGIGTALLRAVLDECMQRGCAVVDLEIDSKHERVRSLYLR
jgi:ribosomal protein S18 acetylase RimI-like enzyme